MKILCVHAHFDDFEFVAAGTFALWRRQAGAALQTKLLVCTDGRAGHHIRTCEETAAMRLAEQEASAHRGGIEFELLRKPDGETFRECRVLSDDFLAALWKAIRDFEPDYLFCPPLPPDTMVGMHPDHVTVAEAIRRIAYMINVPHAFVDKYPISDETQSRWIKTPVILNTYDSYLAGLGGYELVVDVETVFDLIAEMAWCHQSQISEWLPWIGRHHLTKVNSLTEWKVALRERFQRQQRTLNLPIERALEAFMLTAWGAIPTLENLSRDFQGLIVNVEGDDRLGRKLEQWGA